LSGSPVVFARVAAGLAIALTMVSVTQVAASPREQLRASGAIAEAESIGSRLRLADAGFSEGPPSALAALAQAARKQSATPIATGANQARVRDTEIQDLDWLRVGAASARARSSKPIDCSQVDCVAITLDDGPGAHTVELLNQLAAANARATFFVIGAAVAKSPELTAAVVAGGHELGLHSHTHPRMPTLSDDAIRREFDTSRAAIEAAVGQNINIYRPPYGLHSKRVGRLAEAAVIMWDVDPQDWRRSSQRSIAKHVLKRVQPGSIVLLHELTATTKVLPEILSGLQDAGYQLVTVSELLGTKLVNGQVYRAGPAPVE
jgi:peptidoglycan-N-acetylglucosamine deacetylase